MAVKFDRGLRSAAYEASSDNFSAYVDKLNAQHPDRDVNGLEIQQSWEARSAAEAYELSLKREVEAGKRELEKQKKEILQRIEDKKRELKGEPTGFIL